MDNYDCLISEGEARFSLNSPGLSSGYCSAEENLLHSKYTGGGRGGEGVGGSDGPSYHGYGLGGDFDYGWGGGGGGGQSPIFSYSPSPPASQGGVLGGGVGVEDMITSRTGSGSTLVAIDSLPDLKTSPSFDDLMDTLFDPFTSIVNNSSSDAHADIDMADLDSSMAPSLMFSSSGGRGSSGTLPRAMPSVSSDSSLISLLRNSPDYRFTAATDLSGTSGNSGGMYGTGGTGSTDGSSGRVRFMGGAEIDEMYNNTSSYSSSSSSSTRLQQQQNNTDGSAMSYAPAIHSSQTINSAQQFSVVNSRTTTNNSSNNNASIKSGDGSGGLCHTVSSLHSHMADMSDMSAAGEASDYILQLGYPRLPLATNNPGILHRVPPTQQTSNQASVSVGLGQKGVSFAASIRSVESKGWARMKGGAVATSCGSLLRHSVSIPNNMSSAVGLPARHNPGVQGNPGAMGNPQRNNDMKSSGDRPNSCDMKGGRASSAYPGLDDHRYTLKSVPPTNHKAPAGKLRRSGGVGSGSGHGSSTSLSTAAAQGMKTVGGNTSILEAFLRSTRPMDPNKGSNAALAAEGLSYLRLDDNRYGMGDMSITGCLGGSDGTSSTGAGGPCTSGMLLKRLLTGEMDQRQALQQQQQQQQKQQLQQQLKKMKVERPYTTVLAAAAASQSSREVKHEEEEGEEHGGVLSGLGQCHLRCPPIDCPLTDGFGLDVDLSSLDDTSQMLGLNSLLGAGVPDITDSIWLGDITDQLAVSELEEILREQARQENLWLEHYIPDKYV